MSGKPNSVEITALLEHMRRINELRESIGKRKEVILLQESSLKMEVEESRDLWHKCKELIEGMDVHTEGNWGFEGRYHWFILELVRQAETLGRLTP